MPPLVSENHILLDYFKRGRLLEFHKGEVIVNGNEQPQGVYYIASGFVKIYAISNEGEEYIHIIYKTGEVFPLVWALKGLERRAFYESLGESSLWCLNREEFLELQNEEPRLAALVLDQLAAQFGIYADRVDNLEYKRARDRLVYRLLFMASRFGERQGNQVFFEAIFTQQTIASSINMARESVTREFEKLQSHGLVAYKNRRIVIIDLAGLTDQLSEPVDVTFWGLIKGEQERA